VNESGLSIVKTIGWYFWGIEMFVMKILLLYFVSISTGHMTVRKIMATYPKYTIAGISATIPILVLVVRELTRLMHY
jgi:hypothetical protein